ncbi:glycan-binding surface protein [Bacteroides sp. UBA939]|uniref:glycan-binding surface protein n=1 Tax=Bacteroides sp. UBA939 TaxID=1946092 RepID=UPI0025BBC50A|nr:glycan-binding surface protein [Bacteroides sp. UBA939]
MKNIIGFRNIYLAGALLFGMSLVGCSDDDNPVLIETTGITLMSDMNTPVTEAALGDFIAIHGTGLAYENIDSILVNDVKVDMLETYSEKDILYMQVPVKLPGVETNKIYIHNSKGVAELPFRALAPNLKLTRMFNEYTKPGDTIMIYGDFFDLYEIDSLNAVVDFNGKTSGVISSSNTYLTAKVPVDVDKNIKVKVRGIKHDVEAVCPGRYYDRELMIMDFDELLPSNPMYVVTDVGDAQRLSGNFLRIDDTAVWSGWWYLAEKGGIKYTDDMLDNYQNYVVKCEFRTANQFIENRIRFCNYVFWDAAPMEWYASDFVLQSYNRWETITLPFVVNRSATYPQNSYYNSFNIRLEIEPTIARNFSFDNIRICRRGD